MFVIKKETKELWVKIYDNINMVFDSGRLHFKSIIKVSEMLSQKEYTFNPITSKALWKMGYGTVQLSAFVPLIYGEKISALLEFRKYDMAGALITFEQEDLINDFFVDEESFKKKHSVGREISDTMACLQFHNIRFFVDAYVANQIYCLFNELSKEYIKTQNQILKNMGVEKLKREGELFYLKSISLKEWEEIKYFAKYHDYCNENGTEEWNIFNSMINIDTSLILLPYANGTIKGGHIYARICVISSKISDELVDVYWDPRMVVNSYLQFNFDNITRWKADYTLEWLEKKLLPEAHKYYDENISDYKKGFWTKINKFIHKCILL